MSERLIPLMISPEERRELIRQKVVAGLSESFPVKSRNKTLELGDIRFDAKDYSPTQQKDAILRGDTLFESVRGTVRLRDKDGQVMDEMKNFTLARVPWFTPRHTLIIAGNEYSVSNQVRPKPGVYARKRANGILEANFNTRGGSNFNVSMDPEQGVPHMEYGSTKIPLYPILRKSGLSHDAIAHSWGKDLADDNAKKLLRYGDRAVDALYKKVLPVYHHDAKLDADEKIKAIYERYSRMYMDPEVNTRTLGKAYANVTPNSLLDASGKVLRIFRNADEVDDRDNLDFKVMHSVDDFFKEIISLNARDIARKTAIKMEATPELRKVMPSGPFTPGLLKFVNTSQLAAVPTQTNPMELIDAAMRVTSLGEGGISTERAIPMEMRQIHVTQLGALDPFRTPESFRAGIDVRAAMLTKRDQKGNIYVPVFDVKSKKNIYIRAGDLKSSVVAFPNQKLKGTVDALVDGVVRKTPANKVRYQVPHPSVMYSPTTNLIPFIESLRGNRSVMGSKMQTQALSLADREEPLVQVQSPTGKSFEHHMGNILNPRSPVKGKVAKVDGDYIYIRPDKEKTAAQGGALVKVPYEHFFPLAAKTHLTHDLTVKAGDNVEAGQQLGESNFTRNGTLALGKNMTVAYMPYYGANSNDAIVVSESAAKKLTSERMYKLIIPRDPDMVFQKDKHRLYYGHSYTKDQYGMADTDGVIRPGTKILSGDPIAFGLRKSQMTADDLLLGRLHKSLVKPYREGSQLWDHDHPGEVIDVVKTPKRIAVTVRTQEPVTVGDKLSGRGGNKGVVSRVIPDDQMIQDESGAPIDVILTSAGIVSRTNPGVILETAVGKVAHKLGKPILIENQSGKDNVQWAKDLLKKHGVKDKESVYDPISRKTIPKVFVGRQYMFKLMKSTDTNYSARGVANYDMNQQPTKGGIQSAKAIGKMEFDALVGHNARNILRDVATIKSQKNDEFWRAVQLGYPTPPPKATFAYDKLLNMMVGAGIHVHRKGNLLSVSPLTDKHIKEISSGEIKEPKMVRAKDLKPESGGLFDPAITGGVAGTKWSHITLAEPVVSPVFRDPVRHLLGMTNPQLDVVIKEKGGGFIRKELAKINLDKKEEEVRTSAAKKTGSALDTTVKQLKYLRALKEQNLRPEDAYVISRIPVVPPVVRPILPGKGGQELVYGDINPLYRDLLYVNNQFKEVKKAQFVPGEEEKMRPALHEAVGAVFGVNDPVTTKSRARGHKGFLTYISGTNSPKYGYFQSKIMKRTQDVSGRGTIVPDHTLGLDEVGIPEDMMWTMYDKFVIRRLVQNGYPALQASQMIKDRHPLAREMLLRETKERPVIVNRAPTLHRYNMVAAYPQMTAGKTIRVHPFIESGMNADFDGDCADSHLEFIIGSRYKRLHISECPRLEGSVVMKGNKEIYAVPEGIKVFGYSERSCRVVLCDVTEFSVHHDLEMVEVTTRSGRKTKVSRDHSMFGMNPDTGKLERFKAENGIGWGIPRPRKLFSAEQLQDITLKNKELCASVPLTEDLGWFIGVWAGDGWISHVIGRGPTTVGVATISKALRDKFEGIAQTFIPDIVAKDYINEHYFNGVKCTSKKTHLNSEKLSRVFDDLTEGCRGAANKHLPSYFVQAPREFLLGLLGGLLDTDGTVSIVKAKAKNKPQFMVQYTTMSDALRDHVGILATMLGIRSNVSSYTKKTGGNIYHQITLATPDVARIATEIPCVNEVKREYLDLLSKEIFNPGAPENARWDTVPIPTETASLLRKLCGNPCKKLPNLSEEEARRRTAVACTYQKLSKATREGNISRQALYEVITLLGEDTVISCAIGDWYLLVTNEDLLWDFIDSVDELPGRRTAWDLTVPDGNTFMTSNQLIVYDTMMVHAPVSPSAVTDAKNMTLSSLLFSDKSRSDLLVFPKHEAIMGLSHASQLDDKNKPVKFKTTGDAMVAYKAGKITLGTRVVIEKD